MKKICVFAGAAPGTDPAYGEAAYELGRTIAGLGMGLVYGGGRSGLMGRVADGAVEAGGHVTGIIPKFLDKIEIGHEGVTKLHVIDTMHQRKEMMYAQRRLCRSAGRAARLTRPWRSQPGASSIPQEAGDHSQYQRLLGPSS